MPLSTARYLFEGDPACGFEIKAGQPESLLQFLMLFQSARDPAICRVELHSLSSPPKAEKEGSPAGTPDRRACMLGILDLSD